MHPGTIGFWRNRLGPCGGDVCVATYLPITLGNVGATDCQIATKNTVCTPGKKIVVDSTAEAGRIFDNTAAKDATQKLAGQLLATKLNIAANTGDATCLAATITAADNAITTYGYNTNPQGAARQLMLGLANELNFWNNWGVCL
jgi:hypothetical protein